MPLSDKISLNCKDFLYKSDFKPEEYIHILPYNCVIALVRFRTTNNRLQVNVLRFNNVDRNDRLCALCNARAIGDADHYLFSCQYFDDKRKECLDRKYHTNSNHHKFEALFNTDSKVELLKLKHFIDCINNTLR